MRYEAKFTPTPDDMVTGHRMRNGQSDDVWKLSVITAVLILAVFGIAAYLLEFLAIGIMGVVLVPIAFIAIGMEWNVRRMARKWSQEELNFSLSESGVEFRSSAVQAKHVWSLFTRASLDDRGLLLVWDSGYWFIPARAFASGYFPRQELKTLLLANLKNT